MEPFRFLRVVIDSGLVGRKVSRGNPRPGMALDWVLDEKNFGKSKEVLLVGTGLKMTSKVWATHGAP